MEKLREAKENLEAAQVTARKKQDAELESLRTQLIFKQHEIEASRRAVPRVPLPSQPAGSPQRQRSELPRTPHKSHVAALQGLSQRPAAPPPRLSNARPQLPGFVNAFAMSSPKKSKGKARASVIEESQRTLDWDLDPPPLSPIRGSVKAPAHSQLDEGMEIDGGEDGGQAGSTTYPEAEFHMDVADDVKPPQPIAQVDVLKASKSFDWVSWVRLQFPYLTRLGFTLQLIDEATGTRSRDATARSEYNSTSASSATAWCKSHSHLLLGMHVPYGCGGWLGRVRARCAYCCKFISTNREYIATRSPGQLDFSSYFPRY